MAVVVIINDERRTLVAEMVWLRRVRKRPGKIGSEMRSFGKSWNNGRIQLELRTRKTNLVLASVKDGRLEIAGHGTQESGWGLKSKFPPRQKLLHKDFDYITYGNFDYC